MYRFTLFVLICAISSVGFGSKLYAGQNLTLLPALPFENYFAAKRADHEILKFNDFSGKIKAQRIKKLLRSGSILGDRVLLKNNTAIYFPEGYIVSSTLRIEQWRPKNRVHPKQIYSVNDVESNPDFRLIQEIDQHLGKVCAIVPSHDQKLSTRLRKLPNGVISLVQRVRGRLDKIIGKPSEDVIITSSLNPTYISSDIAIQKMASSCI